MTRRPVVPLAVVVLFCVTFAFAADPTPPATAPAGAAETAAKDVAPTPGRKTLPATVTPEAAAVLEKVSAAYGNLKRLDLAATLSGEFDVAGQKEDHKAEFTTAFAAPNKFKHDVKGEQIIGSTGERLYAHAMSRNVYISADAPKEKVMSDALPEQFAELIGGQDLSLILALSKDPAAELKQSYQKIDKAPDVLVGDKSYTALALSNESTGPRATLLLDPATSLLRRATIDISPVLASQGAADVKKAQVTIDYTAVTPDAVGDAKPDQFAWAPPAGAKDARQMAQQAGAEPGGAAAELEGKPAPDFKLKDLDDKEIALADLKGKVVVLDFWATWCGPCVASLPKIDKLYQEKKDAGVHIFAVNEGEDKELVQGFMKSKKLTLPALLDSDSKVGQAYKADAIPETVVIGKDGVVRKVFVGAGPTIETELRAAIEAALKAK